MKRIIILSIIICFIGCSSSKIYFKNKYSDKKERIEHIDSYFIWVMDTKEHIPMADSKYWYMMQEAYFEALQISEDTTLLKETRDYAKYVLAFGYYIAGFYDLCAEIHEELIIDVDPTLKIDLLKDMSNNYEMIGDYEKYTNIVEKRIAIKQNVMSEDYNDLAVGYLKIGKYKECVEYVNRIPLDSISAITRVTSASAYGYNKEYLQARNELNKAISKNNKRAKKDFDELIAKGDSIYWLEDYKKIVLNNYPSNSISKEEFVQINNIHSSKYASILWFDEVFSLYGGAFYKAVDNESYSSEPKLPIPIADLKYCFSVIRGIPFFTVHNSDNRDNFIKKLDKYKSLTEGNTNYLLLDENTAIFYYAEWQENLIKNHLFGFSGT